MRGVSLDIYDKVRHEDLLIKFTSHIAEEDLLSLLECYLRGRKQRIVLNIQISDWRKINSLALHGSIFILIHINDLPESITLIRKIFADNISHFSKVIKTINSQNLLEIGPTNGKCNSVLIQRKSK